MSLEFLIGYNRVNQKCFSLTFKKGPAPDGWALSPASGLALGLSPTPTPETPNIFTSSIQRTLG